MTPMQEFALNELRKRKEEGIGGSYLAVLWQQHNGRYAHGSSRVRFGAISAAYRALGSLVSQNKARVEITSTSSGYTIYHFYII